MNTGTGIYPDISDPNFNKKISLKKEFNIKFKGPLQPHQKFLSNFINPLTQYNSVLVYHGTGLGKTLSSIAIAENFKKNYKIIVLVKNKILEDNYKNEVSRYYLSTGLSGSTSTSSEIPDETKKIYNVSTYANLKVRKNVSNCVLIIDEIHNLVTTENYNLLKKVLANSSNFKFVMLTATPMYDTILPIFSIVNLFRLCNKEPPFVETITRLTKLDYVKKSKDIYELTVEGKKLLETELKGKVSYLINNASATTLPSKSYIGTGISTVRGSIKIHRSEMSKFQAEWYRKYSTSSKGDNLFYDVSLASNFVFPDGSIGKEGYSKYIKSKKGYIQPLDFKYIKEYSCKLYEILKLTFESPGKVFIYSNFVENSGTDLIKAALRINRIRYISITEGMSIEKRRRVVSVFNSDANAKGDIIKVIVGSPVISEGITLKGIRQVHVLEPHWNLSRLDQVIGRSVRFESHSQLPVKDRNVKVYLHAAVLGRLKTIDLLKYQTAENKDFAIKQVENVVKKIAIDCYINKNVNTLERSKDYSRDCGYTKCNYSCENEPKLNDPIDYTTYSLQRHSLEEYTFIIAGIKKLFENNFVYDLRSIVNSFRGDNVEKENIYFVLSKMINSGTEIISPRGTKGTIYNVNNYYIFNPLDNVNQEPFFNKLFKVELNNSSLEKALFNKKTSVVKRSSGSSFGSLNSSGSSGSSIISRSSRSLRSSLSSVSSRSKTFSKKSK